VKYKPSGFTGKDGILKNFIRPFKPQQHEPVKRFETAPGEQLQIDFTVLYPRPHWARIHGATVKALFEATG
jgi:transposase